MTEKEDKAEIKKMKKALESFQKEVRRQERAYREEMKIIKAFGEVSFALQKPKRR